MDLSTLTQDSFSRPVVLLHLDGAQPLSDALVEKVAKCITLTEEMESQPILCLCLSGSAEGAEPVPWPGRTNVQQVTKWERTLRKFERLDALTMILCEGQCSWLALELMMVADWRIASEYFTMSVGAADGALWPSMSLRRLARQVGEGVARNLLLSGDNLDISSASKARIIDEVVLDGTSLVQATNAFLSKSRFVDFALRRMLLEESTSATYEDALGSHLAACDRALRRSSSLV